MATFEAKFKALMQALAAKMDLPEGFESLMEEIMKEVGFNATSAPVSSGLPAITLKPTAKGGRRTGYNVFQSKRNAELKAASVDSSLRQGQIVTEWHAMTEEDRKKWNLIAAGGNASTGSTTAAPKRMSGWNLYMKKEMEARKGKITKGGPAPLKAIGAAWKALPKEEQEKWNAMAKAGTVPPKVESNTVADPPVDQELDEDELAVIADMESEQAEKQAEEPDA